MSPNELAIDLGISPKRLRSWLRSTHSRHPGHKGSAWGDLSAAVVSDARRHFGMASSQSAPPRRSAPSAAASTRAPRASDESYVVDLCDEVLGAKASRQHRFPWLLGDAAATGRRVALPVDAYYSQHRLVVEYHERQHTEPVAHFDKPDRATVSGVHRGEQRRIYDERRQVEIPAHGVRLVVISASDLDSTASGRLRRSRASDLQIVQRLLGK